MGILKKIGDATGLSTLLGEAKGVLGPAPQPGVGGPLKDPNDAGRLVRDPNTGHYYDPATGTSYMDEYGQTPVANPNVAQQVATNYANQQAFNKQLAESRAGVRGAVGGLTGLAGDYRAVINGTAPSVAQSQMRTGLETINASQLSGASGVGGDNAFAARRAALQNIAHAGLRANQDASLLRAKEVADARAGIGQAFSASGNLSQNQYGTDASAGLRSGELALSGQRGQQGMDASADAAGKAGLTGLISTGLTLGALMSDERVKEDIRPEPGGGIAEFLNSLAPTSFEYAGDGGQERHGVVAQDVERSGIGRDLVEEGPGGVKAIPVDQGLGVTLAALGDLHRRLLALEGGGRRG
jgi:hypothetical protein